MKMQKSVIILKKNVKINRKIINIVRLEIIFIVQGNIEALRIGYAI